MDDGSNPEKQPGQGVPGQLWDGAAAARALAATRSGETKSWCCEASPGSLRAGCSLHVVAAPPGGSRGE